MYIIKVESHRFPGDKTEEDHQRIRTNNIVTWILDRDTVEASCTSTVKRSVSAPTTTAQHNVNKHAK